MPSLDAGGPPLVVFARGSHYAVEWLCDSEFDVIGLDWSVDPETARYDAPSLTRGVRVCVCVLAAFVQRGQAAALARSSDRQMLTMGNALPPSVMTGRR